MDLQPTPFVSAAQAQPTLSKWQTSRLLRKATYGFFKENKDLLWFPILHIISVMVAGFVFALFFMAPVLVTLFATHAIQNPAAFKTACFIFFALWYFTTYFLTAFFQSCVISVTSNRLNNQPASFGSGIATSFKRIGKLLLWTLVGSTVGILLHLLSRSHKLIAAIVALILGAAWAITTYFVLPGVVIDNIGVFDAMKNSVQAIKKTWGETAFSIIGVFGALWLLLILIMFGAAIVFTIVNHLSIVFVILCLLAFFVVILVYGAISSVLSTILKVVLYEYAKTGKTTATFTPELLSAAVRTK